LQFHCGNPPPAAAPKTLILIAIDFAEMPCKKDKSPMTGLLSKPNAVDQRLAMYIVTSKPKRISVYSGLVHIIFLQKG